MAKLTFYYGTMSSGKTIDLIETAYKYNSKGMKAIVIKPKIDTKGNDKIVSRIGLEKKADIVLGKEESIFDYSRIIKDVTCVLVDEAQFLNEVQVQELFILTKELNIPVICYGLRTDFQGKLFEGSKALFCYADDFEKLRELKKVKEIVIVINRDIDFKNIVFTPIDLENSDVKIIGKNKSIKNLIIENENEDQEELRNNQSQDDIVQYKSINEKI